MKKYLFLTLLFPSIALGWTEGFNFRSTSGYVTDGTDQTYVLCETYPTTRAGATFGWDTCSTGDDKRDRNSSVDVRLAGINGTGGSDTPPHTFRVDLPATGDYTITLATGDATFDQNKTRVYLYDDTTLFATISTDTNCAGGSFIDATGTKYTAANWPGSNTGVVRTFASTVFKVVIGASGAPNVQSSLAHVSITDGSGGGGGGSAVSAIVQEGGW